jgi:hypothetical protein
MKYLQSKSVFEHYLKRFNESNTDNIILNVKDILLPISDMGYEISVIEENYLFQLIIRVVTWTDKRLWITDEVKEEFIRMKDYLQSEGYDSIDVLYYLAGGGALSSRKIEEFDRFMRYEQWQKVKIGNLIFVAKKDII